MNNTSVNALAAKGLQAVVNWGKSMVFDEWVVKLYARFAFEYYYNGVRFYFI